MLGEGSNYLLVAHNDICHQIHHESSTLYKAENTACYRNIESLPVLPVLAVLCEKNELSQCFLNAFSVLDRVTDVYRHKCLEQIFWK